MTETGMIIIWAAVVAIALLVEYFSCELVSIWFAGAGILSLFLAAFSVDIWIQVVVFFVLAGLLIGFLRQIVKRKLDKDHIPTNIVDTYTGKKLKLLKDPSEDGESEIALDNGTNWRVQVDGEGAKKGSLVEITGMKGNTFLAKFTN